MGVLGSVPGESSQCKFSESWQFKFGDAASQPEMSFSVRLHGGEDKSLGLVSRS